MNGAELAAVITSALRAEADPERAPGQQAYMKSSLPFFGVPVPRARRITAAAARGIRDTGTLRDAAVQLWDHAVAREQWYAALALLALRPHRGDLALLALIERFVRSAQWWDVTDELAHRVADLLDVHPVAVSAFVREWMTDENLWMRRLAILSQLGRKDRVDRALLTETIEANLGDRDFFIRKAIGWALREVARTDPAGVRHFLDEHPALSPLSVREASKHLTQ
ncbi:DNA alkylation repair protein [Microbacterium sp. GXS0129]|uniref:DNA alkylation repair protein n=1 Tax=Microbacterium sp. GXS0129 TaxID=3377836 RepID=UPI00383B4F97